MPTELLSIVIPVFHSEEMLEDLYSEISKSLDGKINFEVIFVDDGSRDGSWNILEKLKQKFPSKITAVRFTKNFGQHIALACGFGFAKGDFIVTMDDDLQHPPAEIPKLIARQKETGADVVYGEYEVKQHAAWRNAGSWMVKKSSKVTEGHTGMGSSFRLLTKSLAEKITLHLQTSFVFIDEIIHWHTGRIASVPVEHHPRKKGKSHYTGKKLVSLYFDLVINYSAMPLKLMTFIGMLSSLVTFGFGVRFIYKKIVHGSAVPGFTATIVTILFSTSILMLCMGVIGQYLYKLYQRQNGRPQFTIERVI